MLLYDEDDHIDHATCSQVLQPEEEAALYTKLTSHQTPHVFDRHFYLFDWSQLPPGSKQVRLSFKMMPTVLITTDGVGGFNRRDPYF